MDYKEFIQAIERLNVDIYPHTFLGREFVGIIIDPTKEMGPYKAMYGREEDHPDPVASFPSASI